MTSVETAAALDPTHARWTREPVAVSTSATGVMTVEAAEGSDWWRDTGYGFRHENGHALLTPWHENTAVEVTFALDGFTGQFDQAGLAIMVDEATWIKAGVEHADGHHQLGSVVTVGASDWSTGRVDEWDGTAVTIRASRVADAVVIRARSAPLEGSTVTEPDAANEHDWRLVRVARFPHADARIGPMVCAPTRAGLTVRFLQWRATEPDPGIHPDE